MQPNASLSFPLAVQLVTWEKFLNVSCAVVDAEGEVELSGGATAGQQLSRVGLKIPPPTPPRSELRSCVELELFLLPSLC